MKRLFSLILVFVMMLSLCACSGSGEEGKDGNAMEGLQVGFAKINITPTTPVGLGGYSDHETRISQGFLDYIYTTCVAVTSGEETILVYTMDLGGTSHAINEKVREKVTAATGIPGEKIFVGMTHNHSGPALYDDQIYNACAEAATKALADRAPAQLKATTKKVEGMNFVRHYKMADGSYAGSNFGSFDKEIVGHAEEKDDQLILVQFDRAEDKKDIVLVNWQAHPDSAIEAGYTSINASWVGPLRDELESLSGCLVAYFTGASGNMGQDSRIESEMNRLSWRDYGKKMGQIANEAMAELQPVEGTSVKTTGTMFTVENDHSWDDQVPQANEVYDLWKSAGLAAGDALAKTYGFSSSYHARAIRARAERNETEELEVCAFSIGGIGFTTGTYEMFSTSSLQVKEQSPFDITFIITGNSTYIPSLQAFEYRSYESDTGFYVPGTAEKLVDNYVKMLNEVK